MDDSNSDLAEAQIERERRKVFGGRNEGDTYKRSGNSNWIPPSVQNALFIASILGLAAATWNYKESIAVLRTTQEFQQRQIDRIERRQDALEGKITRGADAPDQQ